MKNKVKTAVKPTDAATPRPWKVSGLRTFKSISGDSPSILDRPHIADMTGEKSDANAALIVRAVNLLEAHEAVAETGHRLIVAMGDAKKGSHRVRFERVQEFNQALAQLAKLKEKNK